MLEFRNWILGHRYDFTKDGVKAAKANRSPRTAVNKIMRVNHFICKTLKLQPGKGPIRLVDAEKIIVKKAANDVEYYSEEELEKFFAACTPEQNLLFMVFLKSGCRRDEIAYLYWDDIDFEGGTLHVCAKPEFDFTTKTKEERRVELPDDLIARLKEAQKTAKHRLVFPTGNGGPLGNSLLVACKRIGKRAGLNCGKCPTCVSKGECEHIYLHRFRATCGTRMLQRGVPVTDVQEHLGHNDLASTMRYLGNLKKKARRQMVNSVWGNVTAIPEPVTASVQ
jgi:integrase